MNETVLMEGMANPIRKSGFVGNGRAALTDRRFVFFKHGIAKVLVLGALVNLTSGSFEYDIPVSAMKDVSIRRYGLGYALIITCRDHSIYRYGITEPEKWMKAFEAAIE